MLLVAPRFLQLLSITAPGYFCPGGCYSPFGEPTGGVCPTGTYCPPSSQMPIPCEPGTFSDGTGRSIPCDPCPMGRFAPQAGSASLDECRLCGSNLTTLRAGASSRASCVARAYVCPAGTSANRNPPLSLDDCEDIECPAGMRLSADQASCEGESACCKRTVRPANAPVLQAAHPGLSRCSCRVLVPCRLPARLFRRPAAVSHV